MDIPLTIAGSIAIIAAAIHGLAGEILVVRRLSPETLPSSRFGRPAMTKAMIHVSWHIATIAFLAIGLVLLLSGTALEGETPRAILLVAAGAATGFAAVAVGLGGAYRQFRSLISHPGPAVLTTIAALAWWGAV